MVSDHPKINVDKIAILNPYLQGGHFNIAESESSKRFIEAGKNIGIEVKVFAKSEEVPDFNPDFVIAITYQEGKLTHYPTYVSMNIAPSLIKDVQRFTRNILSCDGFLTVSSSVKEWLTQLCATHNKVPYIGHAAFSVPRTDFKPCDFKNAKVMYVGTNWDGLRHKELFSQLESGEYLKCFGPENKWATYPTTLYAGPVAFDGVSIFKLYQKYGAGLCMGLPIFDKEGIASSRTFEIAAASALPVCAQNSLIKELYGDSVLYVDTEVTTENLAAQIVESVQWMRTNPQQAQAMAENAHKIFNQNLSMETYIREMVALHQKVMLEKCYIISNNAGIRFSNKAPLQDSAKVTYLLWAEHIEFRQLRIIKDILNQSYPYIEILILTTASPLVYAEYLAGFNLQAKNIHFIHYSGVANNKDVYSRLKDLNTKWLGILTINDIIFPNHTAVLLDHYAVENLKGNKITGLLSGHLECSYSHVLPEVMSNEHYIHTENKVRIAYSTIVPDNTINSLLMNFQSIDNDFFETLPFNTLRPKVIIKYLQSNGSIMTVQEVTASTNIDHNILQDEVSKAFDRAFEQVPPLQSQVTALQNELSVMINSTSWKITAPLRKLSRSLKKTFKRAGAV